MAKGSSQQQAVIGANTQVRGRVSGDGDLLVLGHIEGEISLDGDLQVGPSARLVSNVEADSVDVSGSIEGDVTAKGTVHVRRGATLRGNVHGGSIAIEEGAEFAGRLHAEFDLPAELAHPADHRAAAGSSRDRRR